MRKKKPAKHLTEGRMSKGGQNDPADMGKRPPAPQGSGGAKPATPPSPAALTPEQLAELLTKAGGRRVTAANVAAHVAAGAPSHADGTLHLVHYAAWLAGQVD